jgi:two-component system KDP operon response regulator KdpE
VIGKAVLIIDDEPGLCQVVSMIFERAGATVHAVGTGDEGLGYLRRHQSDLVILDILLPGIDGFEICRRIRQFSDVPVIMLTALSGNEQLVFALEAGADDYIAKPFDASVFVARAKAVIRRCRFQEAERASSIYDDGYLIVDLNARRVQAAGRLVGLTPKEFDLLAYLFRHANLVCTFKQILGNVWGTAYLDNPEYIHAFIWQLRSKLEADPRNPVYFISEHGVGYRFESQLMGNHRPVGSTTPAPHLPGSI